MLINDKEQPLPTKLTFNNSSINKQASLSHTSWRTLSFQPKYLSHASAKRAACMVPVEPDSAKASMEWSYSFPSHTIKGCWTGTTGMQIQWFSTSLVEKNALNEQEGRCLWAGTTYWSSPLSPCQPHTLALHSPFILPIAATLFLSSELASLYAGFLCIQQTTKPSI